ncbi:LOB domain-containing protein 38-like [Salvia miltiorrhiza]|uniref:LOB domain-containing protein 38-like n=1 Tax=Salvia miltiorrhiza TaxID=226208 RepID=UPI0025AD8438|nr:LOB domain-containing protein 38-like [Salvia miltiorrhiza]
MSCNGCRVLRRGCSDQCILRPCLEWIQSPQAQANATLFVSKFFGRSDLMTFIAAVPQSKRPALFQSLLFEACGRTVNPVNGAVGLLSTGNWHICQAAVDTVLAGGVPSPVANPPSVDRVMQRCFVVGESSGAGIINCMEMTASGISELSPESGNGESGVNQAGDKRPKLLNLFA